MLGFWTNVTLRLRIALMKEELTAEEKESSGLRRELLEQAEEARRFQARSHSAERKVREHVMHRVGERTNANVSKNKLEAELVEARELLSKGPTSILYRLRANGWSVTAHSDCPGEEGEMAIRTSFLLTNTIGENVRGEGATDYAALRECEEKIATLFARGIEAEDERLEEVERNT